MRSSSYFAMPGAAASGRRFLRAVLVLPSPRASRRGWPPESGTNHRGRTGRHSRRRSDRPTSPKLWGAFRAVPRGGARWDSVVCPCFTARSTAGSRRLDQANGKVLWQSRSARASLALRSAYTGPAGTSTFAVYSGIRRRPGAAYRRPTWRRLAIRLSGTSDAVPALSRLHIRGVGLLFVFRWRMISKKNSQRARGARAF